MRYARRVYRYKVSFDTNGRYWHIYDRELPAECGLEGEALRWPVNSTDVHSMESIDAKGRALRWLHHCYTEWGGVPLVGGDKITWSVRRPFKAVDIDAFGNIV